MKNWSVSVSVAETEVFDLQAPYKVSEMASESNELALMMIFHK